VKRRFSIGWYLVLGWCVTALAAALVPLLIVPEASRSMYFWPRVFWSEALLFLIWACFALYSLLPFAANKAPSRFGGITPSIALVVLSYAFLSYRAMMIDTFFPQGLMFIRHAHLVFQIALFAVAAVTIALLCFARSLAAGNRPSLATEETPRALHDLLAEKESSLGSPTLGRLKAAVKRLREMLLYSLNESVTWRNPGTYRAIADDVHRLCDQMTTRGENEADWSASCIARAEALIARTKLASAQQIRG